MALDPITAVSNAVSTVTGYFGKKQDRKLAKDAIKGKLAMAKQSGEQTVTLTDAEWENLSVQGQEESWKDEYITIVITAPIVMILAGGVYTAFTSDTRLLDGTLKGLQALKELGVDMGFMMQSVVFAAVGLKVWRARG